MRVRLVSVYSVSLILLGMSVLSCGDAAAPATPISQEDSEEPAKDVLSTLDSGKESKTDVIEEQPPIPTTPCVTNADCESGFCVESAAGKVCTITCVESCPVGWMCSGVQVTPPDITYICIPRFISLCRPCRENTDCNELMQGGTSLCVEHGAAGSYCGGECDTTGQDISAACPENFSCVATQTAAGVIGQCVADSGECSCSQGAIAEELSTDCYQENELGRCDGVRTCGTEGLSACDAQTPETELCDGVDNDCDGETDEESSGTACEISNEHGTCSGVSTCNDGVAGCDGQSPLPETCDLKDNNCDGQIDEGTCDDGNPCTNDTCNASGACIHIAVPLDCDDGNVCTFNDGCQDGACVGQGVDCDDGNVCTADLCDPEIGCVSNAAAGDCDDGVQCTVNDSCTDGKCVGQQADDGHPCDDEEPCTNTDQCTAGECAGAAVKCDDDNPCTDDECTLGVGCTGVPNSLNCDDGDPCTKGDTCVLSQCQSGSALSCDDGEFCTTDSCNSDAGGCVFENNGFSCTDGNACTIGDSCAAGVCGGDPLGCQDGNPCTDDDCAVDSGCTHKDNTAPCNDNSVCTEGDQCSDGICTPGKSKTCDDGNPCTDDSCDALTGCVHTNNVAACTDGNACTVGDTCSGGSCKGLDALTCDDGNPCTEDGCNSDQGCTHANNNELCSDGNVCTEGDICEAGSCVPGNAKFCNDGNVCTDDACNATTGCAHTNNVASCSDGDACTTGDTCSGGSCKGLTEVKCDDGNLCTDNSCNAATGCSFTNNKASCQDGSVCTEGDQCEGGFCVPGASKDCDDGKLCTHDSCDATNGCTHINNTVACDDGSACTVSDACKDGSCAAGAALQCADGNPCTDDSCNVDSGCVYSNNTASCSDGNACTEADTCGGGSCLPGAFKNCDDGKLCTNDSCDAANGCIHGNNTVACDDGSACTVGDACKDGSCTAGAALQCADGNPCTDDSCNVDSGCVYSNNTASCTDDNVCTEVDACSGGNCVPGATKDCNDNNDCTSDTCDAVNGCSSSFVADDTPCGDGSWKCKQGVCKEASCSGGWAYKGKCWYQGPVMSSGNCPTCDTICAGHGGCNETLLNSEGLDQSCTACKATGCPGCGCQDGPGNVSAHEAAPMHNGSTCEYTDHANYPPVCGMNYCNSAVYGRRRLCACNETP